MTKIRFIMCVSWCNVATKLASGCWTPHGEFSQKQSRVSQVGAQECEKTEDYLELFESFGFSFTEPADT